MRQKTEKRKTERDWASISGKNKNRGTGKIGKKMWKYREKDSKSTEKERTE